MKGPSSASSPSSAASLVLADAIDETDELMFTKAQVACRESDYRALFDAMIVSRAVRVAYSAPEVLEIVWPENRNGRPDLRPLTRRSVARADYSDFPIIMEDGYRRPAAAVGGIGGDEYVIVSANQASNERVAIEWTRVTYDGRSQGGDDLGQASLPDGRPYEDDLAADGRLSLRPTAECWELSSDERFLKN